MPFVDQSGAVTSNVMFVLRNRRFWGKVRMYVFHTFAPHTFNERSMLRKGVQIGLIALSLAFVACGGHEHSESTSNDQADTHEQMHEHMQMSKDSASAAIDTLGQEYTSKYICPMHCKGSGSDQSGNCPNCGMDYVMNKDFHEDHEGHQH